MSESSARSTPTQLAALVREVKLLGEALKDDNHTCMEKVLELEDKIWKDEQSIMVRLTRIENAQATKDYSLNRTAIYFALVTGSIGTLLGLVGLVIQMRGGVGP